MKIHNEMGSEAELQPMSQCSFRLKKVPLEHKEPLKNLSCVYLFGDSLYVGTRMSKLYFYRLDGRTLVDQKIIIPHCEIVSSVVADRRYFITVPESDDQSPVSVWEAKTQLFLAALKGHKSQVSKALFLSDQNYLATSSWDSTIKIWNLSSILNWSDDIKTIEAEHPILVLEQINKSVLAFGGDDCYVSFWNWKKMQSIGKYFGHAGSVSFISANLPYIITGGGDRKIKIWNFTYHGNESEEQIVNENEGKMLEAEMDEEEELDSRPRATVNLEREIKSDNDSSLYMVKISETQHFFMDRHGKRFIFEMGKDLKLSPNQFKYNENITGMVNYGKDIIVTTTKGEIKMYQVQWRNNQSSTNIPEQMNP